MGWILDEIINKIGRWYSSVHPMISKYLKIIVIWRNIKKTYILSLIVVGMIPKW
jgi:uncharacterized protein YfbU (UPF0304 family)